MSDRDWFEKYYERIKSGHAKSAKAEEIIHDYLKYNTFVFERYMVKVKHYDIHNDFLILERKNDCSRVTTFKVFIDEILDNKIMS